MLDHSCQAQRHAHAERGHDLYETPSVAVEALLRVLDCRGAPFGSPPAAVAQSPKCCVHMVTTSYAAI